MTLGGFLVIGSAVAATAIGQSAEGPSDRTKSRVVEKLKSSSDFSLDVDNSEAPPVLIQAATVKEATGAEYQTLTGKSSDAPKQITFPDIQVSNNSGRVVKGFTVCLSHKHSNQKHCLKQVDIELQPAGEFALSAERWAGPRRAMTRKFTADKGVVREDKRPLGLDAEEMWIPGSFADYKVSVGHVEFADGGQWLTRR